MIWILFSLLSALFDGLRDFFSKIYTKKVNVNVIPFCIFGFSVLLLIPIVIFQGIPTLTPRFFLAIFISGSLNIIAYQFFFHGIKADDVSLSIPFISFVPAFSIITSAIFLGEKVPFKGIIGILVIVFGSYLLNIDLKKGFLSPFKAIFRRKGPRFVLITAALWSICINFDKIGTGIGGVYFYLLINSIYLFLGFSVIVGIKRVNIKRQISKNYKGLLLISLVAVLAVITFFIAFQDNLISYVTAIKNLGPLSTVTLGAIFLKEKNFKKRILGSIVMFIGVLFIVL
jgi:uncharacterized membrane protein